MLNTKIDDHLSNINFIFSHQRFLKCAKRCAHQPCPTHLSASRTWPPLFQDPEAARLLRRSFRVKPDPSRSSRSSIPTPPTMLVLPRYPSMISSPDGPRRSSAWGSSIGSILYFLASGGFELTDGTSILSSISWLVSPSV